MLGSFPLSMTALGDGVGGCGKEDAFTWPFLGLLVPCYPASALERGSLLGDQREFTEPGMAQMAGSPSWVLFPLWVTSTRQGPVSTLGRLEAGTDDPVCSFLL